MSETPRAVPATRTEVDRRVAVVTPNYPPSVGGVELYHQRIAEHLALTQSVLVLTSGFNLPPGSAALQGPPSETSPRRPEVRYLPSLRFFGERLVLPWVLWSELSRFSPDVVVTSHPSLTGDAAGAFALLRGLPWVATYHGDLMAARPYARTYSWWEARLLRRARDVLVHSEGYRTRLVERGLDPARVEAVTPGPGLGSGLPPKLADAPTPQHPGPEHPFLFVGGLDRARAYKRPERLLQALARLRGEGLPVSAWFVGEGDRRPELEADAARLGLSDSARFLGRLDDVQLAERYQKAWALVLPSTETEGFGLVTLEALHYGCPSIVSSAVGAAPTLLREGCAVSFDTDRPGALEEVLRSIWTDVGRRAELARSARSAAVRYSWASGLPRIAETILNAARALPVGAA